MSKTVAELNASKEAHLADVALREGLDKTTGKIRKHVLICGGTGCTSSGSMTLHDTLVAELNEKGIADEIKVITTGCFGLCALGPIVIVYPDGTFYSRVKPENMKEIVESHLIGGVPVANLEYHEKTGDHHLVNSLNDMTFYKKQKRVALHNCGVIDPENIYEYIARDGYQALAKVLTSMTREEVVQCMLDSGLRGRGGAGFPTGLKWKFAMGSTGKKYVCCNADEGDPGAFMDRSVLEGDPHSVLEAMAIAGYAIGSDEGYIYVRAEYPIAIHRLEIAIRQAREEGLLGKNIFGTDFSFDISLRFGAGAFVCGEETALMTSIEGKRGEPRPRPPFPAIKGLFAKPTILNNVETYANIAQIILKGPQWFASMGTEKSKGTKVFALGGKITNTGLVEVPMGTTLRTLIYDIGGGIIKGRPFKAIQTGGPSGGCIPESLLDLPVDFDTLVEYGAMMGSGGMIVMDDCSCMVEVARYYIDFLCEESCGKCTPCREGLRQMRYILNEICEGRGKEGDVELLEEIGRMMQDASLCALGRTAPNPVLTTIKFFREEYEAHIGEHRCPAGVCAALTRFAIDTQACKGCGMCAKACPTEAISGERKQPYSIDPAACIACGSCREVCNFNAVLTEGR